MPGGAHDPLAEAIDRIVSATRFSAIALSDSGRVAALAAVPPAREGTASLELWMAAPGAQLQPVALAAPPSPGPLRFAPGDDDLLAYVAAAVPGRCALCLFDGAPQPRVAAELAGAIEEIHWSRDGREIVLLVVEPGGDTASPTGAVPAARAGAGPLVRRHDSGRRRLVRVDAASGQARVIAPPGTVWEVSFKGGGLAAALVSADVSESGWYHAQLALVDLDSAALAPLYASSLQMASLALSPDSRRLAFIEGLSSDRGLTPGALRVADLSSGEVTAPCDAQDVTWVDWLGPDELVWAGWHGVGTAVGACRLGGSAPTLRSGPRTAGAGGSARTLWRGPQTLGFALRPQLAIAAGRAVTVLEGDATAPEICELQLAQAGAPVRARTSVNGAFALGGEAGAREVSFPAKDGVEIHGLLRQPRQARALPALVVLAHGGPTLAWTHSHSPGRGLTGALVAAGFSVLLPNPRGSVGRGADFTAANVGDLGGGDFRDLVAGVEWLRATEFAGQEVPAGIAGASYGGFLACWAAATGDTFAAAVAIAVISDWVSCLYTSSTAAFVPIYFPAAGGPRGAAGLGRPGAGADLELCRERSPIAHTGPHSAPTLVIQGELDQCTPASQGIEFYNALRLAGVASELVIYPGEGHAPSRRENQVDLIERSVGWLAEHLPARGSQAQGRA